MEFKLIARDESLPVNAKNLVCLTIDRWNDYSYVTMFFMNVFDDKGKLHSIGNIKIGFEGQTTGTATYEKIQEDYQGKIFEALPSKFFSLGQDVDFYVELMKLPNKIKEEILDKLNDIVYKEDVFDKIQNEQVFNISLMRGVRKETIKEQFSRVLEGKSPLSDFEFYFIRNEIENMGAIKLQFDVHANSMPSTNIHAIIGRNGVGKTTLLNGMIKSFIDKSDNKEMGFCKKEFFYFQLIRNMSVLVMIILGIS
ncbi:MAG: hypothetical protein Q4A74_09795 [Cardiobacteriaceae bacterium]|nr:hypothetical protein [Cardiobacteriaceae bacterium]